MLPPISEYPVSILTVFFTLSRMFSIPETRKDTRNDFQILIPTSEVIAISLHNFFIIHSLRVGWRNFVRVSLIFAIIVSFMLFTVFPLIYVLYFEEFLIHDSRGFMILKKI